MASDVGDTIRLLLVDEDEDRLTLTKRVLEDAHGFKVETTAEPAEALRIIEEAYVEAVVSGHNLPSMNGLELLRKVRERHGDLAFIILTGKGCGEGALEALKLGAGFLETDFDHPRLTELSSMIREAVKRRRVEEALRMAEERYRMLVEGSPLPVSVTVGDRIVYVNERRLELTGHTGQSELIGTSGLDHVHPDDREALRGRIEARAAGETVEPVAWFRLTRLDGSVIHVEDHMSDAVWMGEKAVIHSLVDVTQRVRYMERLKALHRHATLVGKAGTLRDVAELTLGAVGSVLGFEHGSFGVVEGDHLKHVYVWGLEGEFVMALDGPGVTVRAIRTGETQLVRDVREEEGYVLGLAEGVYQPLSELAVPVKLDGEPVAVINVESTRLDAFTWEDRELVETLAEHVSSAMARLRSAEEGRGYVERLEALSRAMASMNNAESLEEVVDHVLSVAEEVIGAPLSAYMWVEGEDLVTAQTRGMPRHGRRLALNGPGVTARAARERRPILVDDARLDPGLVEGSTDNLGELDVPVVADGKVVGVLNMESQKAGYFASHMFLAEALAAHMASNIERLRREEATREAQRRAVEERERAEQARRLEEMKTGFIRTATHEIRTPLTSIKGYAELAQDLIDAEAEPMLAGYFEVMQRNVERLERLTSDLLDVQRIESGRMELEVETLRLAGLLLEAAAEMDPILKGRGQALEVSGGDVWVAADRTRLMQVLVNLVGNASRYSPEGSRIKVTAEAHGGEVHVSVVDPGVGIRAEDLPKLFKPFPDIHVKEVSRGTGLGLSICRGIVELHGGRIWAESGGPGRGSTFTFTLPTVEVTDGA